MGGSCPAVSWRGGGFATGKDPKELAANQSGGYEEARPSGWDPAERVKDQEIDGVEGEILYTTLGMFLFHLTDVELQWASFRAYNDWVAEFSSYAPKRLIGLGLIAMQDMDEARQTCFKCRETRGVASGREATSRPVSV